MCAIDCVLVGLDWVEPMMQFTLHVTCSCISHAYVLHFYILAIFELFWSFSDCLFFSPSLSVYVSSVYGTKTLSLLCLGTLFVLGHLPLLILILSLFGSVMMMPTRHSQRTFLDAAFIRNTKSFWRTSPTPTFPMSFIVEDESHYMTSQSLVLSCLSKSFTPTCTGLIV